MKNTWKFANYLLLLALFAIEAGATSKASISEAFVKAMAPGQTSAAVYFLINNPTEHDLVVNHVTTPVAAAVEVHRVIYDNGMMKMRAINHLKIPRKSKLVFEPGGYHLMLIGVDERLKKGRDFDITIEFEGGVKLSATVKVK